MERKPRIERKQTNDLTLCGIVQVCDFQERKGYEEIKSYEDPLKNLSCCDDEGFLNPGGHFTAPSLKTETLRVTEVIYGVEGVKEISFNFQDYVLMGKPKSICEVIKKTYYWK